MVEGDLRDLTLPSLLTALTHEGSTAALHLEHGADRGALYFHDGTLVHAVAGLTVGDQAVLQLLRRPGGRFRLVRGTGRQLRTITRPLSVLLASADRAGPEAPAGATGGPAAAGDDGSLLHELLAVLTRLEQDRARLAEGRVENGVPALEVVTAAVNSLIEFATRRCGDPDILPSRVLAKLAETQPYTQLLGEDQERITVATAAALLKDWKGSRLDRQHLFEDVSRALIDLLVLYCDRMAALFGEARERGEWRATYGLFVEDLRTAVQQIAV